MAVTINASNTSGFILNSDTSGVLQLQNNGTTAVTIDASQNVGIGTSSPAVSLQINKASDPALRVLETGSSVDTRITSLTTAGILGTYSNHPLVFFTNTAERMRIASNGNVGIGTSTPSELLDVVGSPTIGGTCIRTSSGTAGSAGGQIIMNNTFAGTPNPSKALRINNSGQLEIVNAAYTAVIFQLTNDGAAYNSSGIWGSLSDARVKDNVETARDYLSDLCRLRVVKYSLKSEESEVPTKLGFVAQEVEQVFPNMVEENLDTFSGLGNVKQVKVSVLIPMLVKAIQELNAKVDAQALEIAALKGDK
jgi:hypothetical protein